ncbi:MAG: hypothetical protein WD963_00540 [Candidatus Paceibacterota bacterium]
METSSNPILGDSVFASKWFNPDYLFNQGSSFFHKLFSDGNGGGIGISEGLLVLFYNVLFFLSLFFLTIICYTAIRLLEIRRKEHKHLEHEIAEYAHYQAERQRKIQEGEGVSKNTQWIKTLDYLFSQHPGDWKLSIIEADAMLETLMNQLGFKGETLGDKLKSATQETFRNLTSAWEVHTIRNKIAHEGAGLELSQHETKRLIAIYEQIFREYGYI